MKHEQSLKEILIGLNESFFRIVSNVLKLADTETQFFIKNLGIASLLLFFMIIFSFVTWLGICGFILMSLTFFGLNWFFSLFFVTLLNLFCTLISAKCIIKLKNNLSFEATKRQIIKIANFDKQGYSDGKP